MYIHICISMIAQAGIELGNVHDTQVFPLPPLFLVMDVISLDLYNIHNKDVFVMYIVSLSFKPQT